MTRLYPAANARGLAVSLTPTSLDADSRAFRFAQSLAEAGFRSVVIEARASSSPFWGDMIEVRAAGRHAAELGAGSVFRPGRLRNLVRAIRHGRTGAVGQTALYAGFRAYDWWRHCRLPRRVILPAGLYILHSFELYRAIAPLARRCGSRILYDAHDFYRGIEPAQRLARFDRDRVQPFRCHLEDQLANTADAVTTVSGGVAELIAQSLGRRPEVIRNCHDERYDRAAAAPLRRTLGLGDGDRLAVVVGNYKAGLAVQVAAAALQRLPGNFHLAFVGRGYEMIAATLPEGLVGRRLHLGYAVAPDAIVPAIRSADLGLVLYEPYSDNYRCALPNGFFQLVAAGLPIVRAPLPEIEAVIGDRAIGVCLPGLKTDALAGAMLCCIGDKYRLRTNVSALARTLRWESEARRLLRVVDGVLAPRLAAPAAAY